MQKHGPDFCIEGRGENEQIIRFKIKSGLLTDKAMFHRRKRLHSKVKYDKIT